MCSRCLRYGVMEGLATYTVCMRKGGIFHFFIVNPNVVFRSFFISCQVSEQVYTHILYEIRISLACSPSDQNSIGLKHRNSSTYLFVGCIGHNTNILFSNDKKKCKLLNNVSFSFSSSMNMECQHDTLRLFFLSWCLSPSTFLGFPLCK